MATDVLMPQMGESIAEGTITKWLVQVGDKVERDQPLFEISTDKVDAEIPSPADGVLLEVKYEEGATVGVNELVALIGEAGEAKSAPAEAEEAEPEGAAETEEEPAAKEAKQAAAPAEEEAEEAPEAADAEEGDKGDDAEPADPVAERIREFSSPVVRKIAAEENVDIRDVKGTGVHGRVTKADIMAFIEARDSEPASAVPAKQPAASTPPPADSGPPARRTPTDFFVPAYKEGDDVEIEPMSKIRQITAAHMVYSKATSAHVTTVFHMDLAKVAKVRNRAKNKFFEKQGTKLTYMPFIFRAVANALKNNRKVNASVDGTNIVYKKNINIGMAVALDWGLIVPVIKNADQLSLVGLAKTANDLAERARSKRLSPDEVQGGTFTVTNPGVFGSLFGTPVINQPQVAILGLGVIEKRPVVETDTDGNDVISIKHMAYFAITYDHRLVDGADADEFMNDIKHTLVSESWNELDPYL